MHTLQRRFTHALFAILCAPLSCISHPLATADEAIALVKKHVPFSGHAKARPIEKGLSLAQIYAVKTKNDTYVVRFITHKSPEQRDQEILGLTIASHEGYGPHLFAASREQGFVIMEFLPQEARTFSSAFCSALATFLQKMHHGPPFKASYDIFADIHNNLLRIKTKDTNALPIADIETLVTMLHKALSKHTEEAPCHNDLHPNNLFFDNADCRAIDYETAAVADPYIDLATVATAFCSCPEEEDLLLSAYLGHTPLPCEQAKLCVMKQVVLIDYAVVGLRKYPDTFDRYEVIQAPPLRILFNALVAGNVSAKTPDTFLIFAKTMFTHVLETAQSPAFRDALDLLNLP